MPITDYEPTQSLPSFPIPQPYSYSLIVPLLHYVMFFFIFHRSEQRCDTYFTKPVLFSLTGKSPGPSILLQMMNLHSFLWLNDNTLCIIYNILFTYPSLNRHLEREYPLGTVTVCDDCRHARRCLSY